MKPTKDNATFEEAIAAYKEGKGISRKEWLTSNWFFLWIERPDTHCQAKLTYDNIMATDWQIFDEPENFINEANQI